ncbi:hypothetical protein EDC01DRAFT_630731 [Geopyxis carbonaria]|nr:hypothetical protein EDC01DRAFT_630731 [Geopyxis carbonaria]
MNTDPSQNLSAGHHHPAQAGANPGASNSPVTVDGTSLDSNAAISVPVRGRTSRRNISEESTEAPLTPDQADILCSIMAIDYLDLSDLESCAREKAGLQPIAAKSKRTRPFRVEHRRLRIGSTNRGGLTRRSFESLLERQQKAREITQRGTAVALDLEIAAKRRIAADLDKENAHKRRKIAEKRARLTDLETRIEDAKKKIFDLKTRAVVSESVVTSARAAADEVLNVVSHRTLDAQGHSAWLAATRTDLDRLYNAMLQKTRQWTEYDEKQQRLLYLSQRRWGALGQREFVAEKKEVELFNREQAVWAEESRMYRGQKDCADILVISRLLVPDPVHSASTPTSHGDNVVGIADADDETPDVEEDSPDAVADGATLGHLSRHPYRKQGTKLRAPEEDNLEH